MFETNCKRKSGFTLIELLVVISIIGFLSTLAVVSLNDARKKARDSKRIADIKQLQTALDLYYDTNKSYIISGSCDSTSPNSGWCNSIQSLSSDHWIRNGSTNLTLFLNKDPLDPKPATSPNWAPSGGGTYFYYANGYGGSGQWYMIVYGLENTGNTIQQTDGVRACDGTSFHYGNGLNGIMTVGRSCGQ